MIIQKKQGKKGKEEKMMIERERKKTIMEMKRDRGRRKKGQKGDCCG